MNLRTKVIAALLVGSISLLSVSAAFTIAWYASSQNLGIDSLKLELDTERKLLISTSSNKETFKEKLTYDELDKVGVFKPVSSMFSSRWMATKESKPDFYDCSTSLIRGNGIPYDTTTTVGFYSQDLYLLCDDDAYITLDVNETFFKSNEELNANTAKQLKNRYSDMTEDEILTNLNDLINCLRFSILVPQEDSYSYFVVDPFKNGETDFAGVLDNDKDDYFDTYMSDGSQYEIIYGEVENRESIVYNYADEEIDKKDGYYSSFNAKRRANSYTFDKDASVENGLKIAKENSLSMSDVDGDNSKLVIPVDRNTPTRIVLSIYLEGWDLDCINATMGASFLSQIQFKILRER